MRGKVEHLDSPRRFNCAQQVMEQPTAQRRQLLFGTMACSALQCVADLHLVRIVPPSSWELVEEGVHGLEARESVLL